MTTTKPNPRLLLAAAAALGLLLLTFADHWLWSHTKVADIDALERKDWYRALREVGYWPTWLVVGALLFSLPAAGRAGVGLANANRARSFFSHPGLLLITSSGLGGLAAELLKQLTHRFRPGETGEYFFGWATGERGPGFGLASSHAGVAFGAAFMLARLYPRTTPLGLALALGCSATRLLTGAHFATDIYAAAIMSYAVAAALWRLTHPVPSSPFPVPAP